MSTGYLTDEITFHEEGVTATRSASGYVIRLPRSNSPRHQLGVIAVLWGLCMSARNRERMENLHLTIHIEMEEEFSLPLISTISAINAEFEQAGYKLSVVGGSQAPARLMSPA